MNHEWDDQNNQALFDAVQLNDVSGIKHALKVGADIESRNGLLESPLLSSIRLGHWESFCQLLEAGASANAENFDHQTPMHIAFAEGRGVKWFRKLIGAGASPETKDGFGKTALERASISGRNEIESVIKSGISRSR